MENIAPVTRQEQKKPPKIQAKKRYLYKDGKDSSQDSEGPQFDLEYSNSQYIKIPKEIHQDDKKIMSTEDSLQARKNELKESLHELFGSKTQQEWWPKKTEQAVQVDNQTSKNLVDASTQCSSIDIECTPEKKVE